MTKDNGGNAFPALYHDDTPGMTLRDWFAGQVAAAALVNAKGLTEDNCDEAFSMVARLSYKMADAMIEARAK